jgi:hypothetical protein
MLATCSNWVVPHAASLSRSLNFPSFIRDDRFGEDVNCPRKSKDCAVVGIATPHMWYDQAADDDGGFRKAEAALNLQRESRQVGQILYLQIRLMRDWELFRCYSLNLWRLTAGYPVKSCASWRSESVPYQPKHWPYRMGILHRCSHCSCRSAEFEWNISGWWKVEGLHQSKS